MLYSAGMAAKVKRRDVGALIALIGLELGMLCLLGATCGFDGGNRDLATRGATRIGPLTFYWPSLGPEPLPPEPEEVAPPPEPPKPVEPVRKIPPKRAPEPPAEIAVAPPADVPAMPPVQSLVRNDERPAEVVDPCGGNLCCVAAGSTEAAAAVVGAALREGDSGESDDPDRVVIRWPPSKRDDVVYRVFTLPGRRFLGAYADNWFVHLRKPADPDCYKIQACDRAANPSGAPITICITRRRTWG